MRTMQSLRSIFCGIFLAVLSASPAFSQAVSATLVGTVTDATGAVMADAKVTITETNTGVAHAMLSNESGNYTLANIPPGRYSVTVEMPGFKREVKENIDVVVDSTVRVDMQCRPAPSRRPSR